MRKVRISDSSMELLKYSGHVVPRNEANHIVEQFTVGKEYLVRGSNKDETIKVRCTQNCPHHLVIIK